MTVSHAILREYAVDGWRERLVSGRAVAAVEQWLATVESRPPQPPGASGKPLAWLYLASGQDGGSQGLKVIRAVGLLTDVQRVLDREVTAGELQQLLEIFERHGQPFQGTLVEG